MDMGDQSRQLWRKSSLCTGGDCVEVAFDRQQVRVRDSADASTGTALDFTRRQWGVFVLGVSAHEFDWPSSGIEPADQHAAVEGPRSYKSKDASYNE